MLLTEIRISERKKVYHGSVEEFDGFDINRIGENKADKGGWGIYLTESEEVARQYTPAGKPVIMEFYLPPGNYFDLDNPMDEYTFKELMEHLEYYNSSVHEKAKGLEEEIEEYGFDSYGLTGENFYDIISHDFGSRKGMSLFLAGTGFKGNTFVDKTNPNVRNYVLFSTKGLTRA